MIMSNTISAIRLRATVATPASLRPGARVLPRVLPLVALAVTLAGFARPAAAQGPTDEIQVYDAGIAALGKLNLTLHTNFTPDGAKAPAFPGGIVCNHSFDGGFEWAYGAKPWLELGLYMPLYSIT